MKLQNQMRGTFAFASGAFIELRRHAPSEGPFCEMLRICNSNKESTNECEHLTLQEVLFLRLVIARVF